MAERYRRRRWRGIAAVKRVVTEECFDAVELPTQRAAATVRQRWFGIQQRLTLRALLKQLIGGIIGMASEKKSFEVIVLCAVVLATLVGSTRAARNDRNVADTADVLAA